MKTTPMAVACLALLAVSGQAWASSDGLCGNATPSQWMSRDAAKAKAIEMGYDVRRIKAEDGCYELYAIDKHGKRVEVYLHPATAKVVRVKMSD